MRHTARVRRSGGWWAIDVPELPGVFSQARRLDRVEDMVREAIGLFLDVDPAGVEVLVEMMLPPELRDEVEQASRLRAEADRSQIASSGAMRRVARELVDRGLSIRDIGVILGISHQRVSQLTRRGIGG